MRARMLLLPAALAALMAFCGVAQARDVNCAELPAAVESAGAEPETVVLDEMCTKADVGGSAIAVKSGANLTLRGLTPRTFAGLDGVQIASVGAASVTLEDLTFENADHGGVHLRGVGHVRLADDAFVEDGTLESAGGGLFATTSGAACPAPGGTPAIAVLSSTFRGNTVTFAGQDVQGAGAYLADACPGAGIVVEDSTFEGNVLRGEHAETANGGGLFVGSESETAAPLLQAGNVFADNRVELLRGAPAANGGSFGGGGEWVQGLSLKSIRDRFSGNAVPASPGGSPSGAGLGVAAGTIRDNPCLHGAPPATAVLEDDVLSGNAVLAGAEGLAPAGAAIGFDCGDAGGGRLTLLDSTVTANASQAGGVAGIAGSPTASLTIANSIVSGDTGGTELGGFAAPPAASYSDLCQPGSSSPIAGPGNICAAPRLAGPPADVHETAASPTVQAGSNGLVPAGLGTDFFGVPRIAGGTFERTCIEGLVQLAGPTVDMGAAELPERLVRSHGECAQFKRSSFVFPTVSVRPGGVLLLSFRGLTKGTLLAKAAIPETKTVVVSVHGRRRRVRRSVSVPYGSASRLGQLPPLLRVRIAPSRTALRALRRHHRLTISLSVTYAASRLFPSTQTRAIHVRWIAPAHRR